MFSISNENHKKLIANVDELADKVMILCHEKPVQDIEEIRELFARISYLLSIGKENKPIE